MNINIKRRCVICGKWYKPNARTFLVQVCCGRIKCKIERKARANKSWRARHPDYEKSRRLKKLAWIKLHPGYWKEYRNTHPSYREMDNRRRKASRKLAQNAARQDAIRESAVEKLQCIPRFEPETAARQDTMDRRVDYVVEYLLWKERAARQDGIAIHAHNDP